MGIASNGRPRDSIPGKWPPLSPGKGLEGACFLAAFGSFAAVMVLASFAAVTVLASFAAADAALAGAVLEAWVGPSTESPGTHREVARVRQCTCRLTASLVEHWTKPRLVPLGICSLLDAWARPFPRWPIVVPAW